MTDLAQPMVRIGRSPSAPDAGRAFRPRLAVVIPARNEERRLPRCLDALQQAERVLRRAHPAAVASRIVVVLDRCTDGSREMMAGWPSVEVVVSDHGQVGAARAVGVRRALRSTGDLETPGWVACTDADSAVPADWLVTHLAHAMSGTDLLLGLVQPDPTELTPELLRRWASMHRLTDGHPHVHGANLGISADMYWRAGGFPLVSAHEDVQLTARVRQLGGRVVSTASSPVLTSARTSGRAPAGMAGYLGELTLRGTDGAARPGGSGLRQAIRARVPPSWSLPRS